MPAPAYIPPPAVRQNGIRIIPESRNPWESMVVGVGGGVPASPSGVQSRPKAEVARRNAEQDRYLLHFRGHPSVPATTLDARPPHGPGNPPPPPPETP